MRGILGTNKGQDFRNIIDSFAALGYKIEFRILDAEDYGAPQQRERMFIVGHKLDKPFLYPRPVYGPDSENNTPYVSVAEAIRNLPFTEEDKKDTIFILQLNGGILNLSLLIALAFRIFYIKQIRIRRPKR